MLIETFSIVESTLQTETAPTKCIVDLIIFIKFNITINISTIFYYGVWYFDLLIMVIIIIFIVQFTIYKSQVIV